MSDSNYSNTDIDFAYVRQQMTAVFSLSELITLCFDISIPYDNLPGNTLDDKARELIQYCHRHNMLLKLITKLIAERPHVKWSQSTTELAKQAQESYVEHLLYLHELIKAFNRSRHISSSAERIRTGDSIAYTMRELAPKLLFQFDIDQWLMSLNAGKRLAAITYLDWFKDVGYLDILLDMLRRETPFFQFHILITIHSMIDQVYMHQQSPIRKRIEAYNPPKGSSRLLWKNRVLERLTSVSQTTTKGTGQV